MTSGVWQIFTRALESLKIGTLMGSLQSKKFTSLEFTEDLCIMTIKNDAKFEEESACHFKIDTTTRRI